MQKKDNKQFMHDFKVRQSRQFLAIAITLLILVFLTFMYKRGDFFGNFSKDSIFAAQLLCIFLFICFSALNWRCPSCNKYLGSNINRKTCKKCGTRLR
jgi:hypothetical protein